MKTILKAALLAATPLAAAALAPVTASAQAVPGLAVADLNEVVGKSNAFVLAENQIANTYKAQIDAFEARRKALAAEFQPMAVAFQTAQRAPNPNQAALQTQYAAIQKKEADINAELNRLGQPVARARAFAQEQIVAKLEAATRAAMTKKRVSILLKPEAAHINLPGSEITQDIIAELNTLVPSVGITPPANWQPGGQQGAAAPAAAPAAKPQPSGR